MSMESGQEFDGGKKVILLSWDRIVLIKREQSEICVDLNGKRDDLKSNL